MAARAWRPLLEGDLAAEARDAVETLAAALATWAAGALGEVPVAERRSRGAAVDGGSAGLALFYGYLSKAPGAGAEGHAERANQLLEHAVDTLATTPMGPSLYSGFTGVAWTAEHLDRLLGEAEQEPTATGADMSEAIDESLLAALAAPWTGHYDLISGLVGFGVYALERVPRPSALRCLEAIVDRLDETAESLGEGVAWFTPPELLPSHQREHFPSGYYNLGVAHGVPGVIGLLAEAYRLGIRREKALRLVSGAVRWVLSQRLAAGRGARYPAWVSRGIEARPSRLAWCYGDPGVATTLLRAGRSLGIEPWEETALRLGAHAAAAAPEDSGVDDAGLCHGALGLAHLYNRFYQAGGGELFADAARRWYRLGLDLRAPEGGIAGFRAWRLWPDMRLGWEDDPGFLTGAAGVGLALLAGFTPVEPAWDRLLMV